MKITHRKLSEAIGRKLVEYFVLEVTARSAARVLERQPHTPILFNRTLCPIAYHYVSLEADTIFHGTIKLDESYLGGRGP